MSYLGPRPEQSTTAEAAVLTDLTNLVPGGPGTAIEKKLDGTFTNIAIGSGTGDVVGPASAVDSNFAAFDTITGKLIKDSGKKTSDFTASNVAIVSATKTKITYDAKGLVTSGADATTADIAASTNKNYVTDAQAIVIGNTSGTNTGDNATNSQYSGLATSKANQLTPTDTKIANYTAQPNEIIPCNISAGSIAITLPSAPADGTRVRVQLLTVGADKYLEVKTSGTDKFFATLGPTSLYMYLYGETQEFQYQTAQGFWNGVSSAPTSNFANNFPGIDSITPITNADITIDTATRVLTITPPLGFFNFYVDGNGKSIKYRKTGTVNFPAFTDTSGSWFFYFNSSGTAVTTQTPWTTADFSVAAPVYSLLWNATLYSFTVTAANATVGATYTNNGVTYTVLGTIAGGTTLKMSSTGGEPEASGTLAKASGTGDANITFSAFSSADKLQAQYIEYHVNDIPADTHQWFHLQGAQWISGFVMSNNALVSTDPNTDGRNTTVALSTGSNVDDNLEYTVTNLTGGLAFQQDLGETNAASLNATNSALFKVFRQDAAGLVSFLPATRFQFAWDTATNRPQFITATGTRTLVTDNRWFVYFIYATQNPVNGEAIKVVSAVTEYTSLINAQAVNWIDIQNTYPILNDGEIRPLYRIILYNDNSGGGAFPSGCKYSVIRQTQDLRKTPVTSTATATGSIPASSVTYVPSGTLAATNAQAAIDELEANKVPTTRTLTINGTVYDLSADRTWTVAGGTGGGLPASWFLH
jgi:hypothetical protein